MCDSMSLLYLSVLLYPLCKENEMDYIVYRKKCNGS